MPSPADQAAAMPTVPRPSTPPVQRSRRTRRSVLVIDKVADWTITVGGLMVILAVAGIMLVLIDVVVPLFSGGQVGGRAEFTLPPARARVLATIVDEYNTIGVELTADGSLSAYHLGSGRLLETQRVDLDGKVSAVSLAPAGRDLAIGFADGTVAFATFDVRAENLPGTAVPAGLAPLNERDRTDGRAIFSSIPGGQVRKLIPDFTLGERQPIAEGAAITFADYRPGGTVERPTHALATVDSKGVARVSLAESRMNLLTRKLTTRISTSTLPDLSSGTEAVAILMTEKADQVYLAARSGTLYRFDTRDLEKPVLAESHPALATAGATITAAAFLIGEQAIAIGGSDGSVGVHFRIGDPAAATPDRYRMVAAHVLDRQPAAVTRIAVSKRGRLFVTADAAGNVWLRHSTSQQTLSRLQHPATGAGYDALVLSPRDDGVMALDSDRRASFWHMDVPHPETTLSTIFGKVWYEGYPEPGFTWQSSSGTDSFEPKFSLVPLIFGTLKATVYSLLFAVPVALLAAIYTSEFTHPRVRGVVKPMMEMMASLPSVVLGFIAALVLAPVVETWLGAVLLAFVALPVVLLAPAYVWQLLPVDIVRPLEGLPKLAAMFAMIFVAAFFCYVAGGVFEDLFFSGDIKAWVNGDVGSGRPFVFLLSLPAAYVLAAAAYDRLAERFPVLAVTGGGGRAGLSSLGRWFGVLALAGLIAFAVAAALDSGGIDPRNGLVGTYVQRNTLVVGFAMGFAVIPLIYTLAEDALNAVPEHLRAASLASGATPWQTAIFVILPTAVSGVFAAVMIGMGRAVGETMIVVMAAGNTPLIDWNVFNGLRALSANIAVELPEAVKDGTLYRMLFLAALTLFAATFAINTLAEVIRQRFRKRAFQL
jgi:phosphate transport system permease protein